MNKEYKEAKNWIKNIYVNNTENGNCITIEYNDYYSKSYVYPHKTLFESIDATKEDVNTSITKWENNNEN